MHTKNLLILLIVPVIIVLFVLLFNNEAIDQMPVGDPNQVKKEPIGLAGEDISQQSTESESSEEQNVESAQDKNLQNKPESEESTMVVLNTTQGPIKIEMNSDQTPKTVENFVDLSKQGFYDGTIFHRVINGFMIQGGDPKGDGTGGPGYSIEDEPFEGNYVRGAVAMANKGVPNSAGSQFFIIHKDYNLPKTYVIFGQVVEGLDVVDKIAMAEVEKSQMGEMSKPVNPVSIESVEVIEN